MAYDPKIHNRRSFRLKGYDYSQAGLYFVTICAQGKECLFGEVVEGEMSLKEYGKIVEFTWNDLVNHNGGLQLAAFVVMPNHVHGIAEIVGAGLEPGANLEHRAGLEPAPTGGMKLQGLPEIMRQFKTFSAKRINTTRNMPGTPVWQRNYYEHVIRDEDDYNRIMEYISTNPNDPDNRIIKFDITTASWNIFPPTPNDGSKIHCTPIKLPPVPNPPNIKPLFELFVVIPGGHQDSADAAVQPARSQPFSMNFHFCFTSFQDFTTDS